MSQKYTDQSGAFYEVGFFMEPNLSAPIDARTVVEYQSDLAGISTKYVGMIVTVTDDSAELNGLYMYTAAETWEKINSSGGTGSVSPFGYFDIVVQSDPVVSDISAYNGILAKVDPDDGQGGTIDLTVAISTFTNGAAPMELIGKNYGAFTVILDENARNFITNTALTAGDALVIGESQSLKLWRDNSVNFFKIGMA